MNKRIKNLSLVTILPIMVLSACNKGGSSEEVLRVTNLATALQYMNRYENYTIEYSGMEKIAHSFLFTENAIGVLCEEKKETEVQYISDEGGIYSISYEENKFVAGEYYTDATDLYNCSLQYTMKDKATEYVNSITESTSMTIKDKTYRLALLYTLGFDSSELMEINYIGAFYEDHAVKFTLGYDKTETVYIAKDFGTTRNEIVDTWLASGGRSYVASSDQSKMRDLFNLNNYTQLVYSFGDGEEDEGGFVMFYIFNQNYFGGRYYTSSTLTGAVAIDKTVNINQGTDKEPQYTKLYGCYNYQIDYSDTENYPYGNPTIFTYTALYSKPDVVSYYHYPSQMKLFNNMQFLKPWSNETIPSSIYQPGGTNSYVVTNKALLDDFDSNFSISSSFEGAKGLALGIDMYIDPVDSETEIYFLYYFKLSGYYYLMPIPFGNFGTSRIAIMDYVLENM